MKGHKLSEVSSWRGFIIPLLCAVAPVMVWKEWWERRERESRLCLGLSGQLAWEWPTASGLHLRKSKRTLYECEIWVFFIFLVDQSAIYVIINLFQIVFEWFVWVWKIKRNREVYKMRMNVSCSIIFYSIFTNILDLSFRGLFAMLVKLL